MSTTPQPDLEVVHDDDADRYVLHDRGDTVGFLAYRPVGRPGQTVVDVYTTQISPARRGHGLGEVLVRGALDDLRARGAAVKASCWFVADFLRDHPDYHDLREGAQRPVATRSMPETRTSADAAHEAHEHGMSDTDPSEAGGDPGRPPVER
jgi:uncharacterized protein